MVSELTRNMVWQEILDVERLSRYYDRLSDKYRTKHWIVRFLILISAASGVVNLQNLLFEDWQDTGAVFFDASIAILVAWDFMANYGKKSETLNAISFECHQLWTDWNQLWTELHDDGVSETEIRDRDKRLADRLSMITNWSGLVDIPQDVGLNEECEKEAYEIVRGRFAVQ